MQLFLTLDE